LAAAGLLDRGVDALTCAFVPGVGEGWQPQLGERPVQRGEHARLAGQGNVVAVNVDPVAGSTCVTRDGRLAGMMWRIKDLADPAAVLAPGVVLSRDPAINMANLKTRPRIDAMADACFECGFWEQTWGAAQKAARTALASRRWSSTPAPAPLGLVREIGPHLDDARRARHEGITILDSTSWLSRCLLPSK
jgi:hypothetical protein